MFQFVDLNGTHTNIVRDLTSGLKSDPKYIPGYFIYDKRGSDLFGHICELPEYYLTRTELKILEKFAHEMIRPYRDNGSLVELGSGNLSKIGLLLREFLIHRRNIKYIPIDISGEVLRESAGRLCQDYPGVEVIACCGEYFDCLEYLDRFGEKKLVLWLGSSIGNFSKSGAGQFLIKLKSHLRKDDGLLMGIDLKKDPATVERAYNDRQGVTAEYHLNVLHRLNREFGADFNVDNFYHRSFYDKSSGAVDAYIISRCDQEVHIRDLDLIIRLGEEEKIFNELSCKYEVAEIEALAEYSGFSLEGQWCDRNKDFALVFFRVETG